MIGPTLSSAVSVVGMAAAIAAFVFIEDPWTCAAATVTAIVLSGTIAQALYRHFTDPETKRRDLEDRVRNSSL